MIIRHFGAIQTPVLKKKRDELENPSRFYIISENGDPPFFVEK